MWNKLENYWMTCPWKTFFPRKIAQSPSTCNGPYLKYWFLCLTTYNLPPGNRPICLLTKECFPVILVFKAYIVTEHCNSIRNWQVACRSIELQLEIALFLISKFSSFVNSVYWLWYLNRIIDCTWLCTVSSNSTSFFICPAVPTPPQKADKVEDDTSSGEDNSDDEEAAADNPGVSEYQVPTTVCW